LEHQAETVTRNRKPMSKLVPGLAAPAWEVRVGDYRILYEVRKGRIVRVLRVIFKGRQTIEQALKWSPDE